MGIPTSIIIALVVSGVLAIAALIFMVLMIINKSGCEGTESAECPTFNCPDPNDPQKTAIPAVRP